MSTATLQLVQNCIGQNINKQPIIIDTDVDIDDLWAIVYLINVIKSRYMLLFILLVVTLVIITGSNS